MLQRCSIIVHLRITTKLPGAVQSTPDGRLRSHRTATGGWMTLEVHNTATAEMATPAAAAATLDATQPPAAGQRAAATAAAALVPSPYLHHGPDRAYNPL